jgi:hypothetical protein
VALVAVVCRHLTIARAAEALAVNLRPLVRKTH